jgi:hypothetical protein
MKKIFLLLGFTLLILQCKSQSYLMPNTLWQNYTQYKLYVTTGSYTKAEVSLEKLLQGESLWNAYMQGAVTGRSGLMDSSKKAFDVLYGKVHIAPNISISAASDLRINRLSFDGGSTWINYIYPKDSIIKWIGDSSGRIYYSGQGITVGNDGKINLGGTYNQDINITCTNQKSVTISSDEPASNISKLKVSDGNATLDSRFKDNSQGSTVSTGNNSVEFDAWDPTGSTTAYFDPEVGYKYALNYASYQKLSSDSNRTIPDRQEVKAIALQYGSKIDTTSLSNRINLKLGIHSTADNSSLLEGKDTSWVKAQVTVAKTDSSWKRITVDSLRFAHGGLDQKLYSSVYGISIKETNSSLPGSYGFRYNSINGINPGSPMVYFVTSSSTQPVFIPNITDNNTGYSWYAADKLGLVAGGHSTMTSEYNSSLSKNITKVNDSLYVTSGIKVPRIFADSVYTNNGWHKNLISFSDVPSDTSISCVTSTGKSILLLKSTFSSNSNQVLKTGSPASTYMTFWTSPTSVGGSTNLKWDNTNIINTASAGGYAFGTASNAINYQAGVMSVLLGGVNIAHFGSTSFSLDVPYIVANNDYLNLWANDSVVLKSTKTRLTGTLNLTGLKKSYTQNLKLNSSGNVIADTSNTVNSIGVDELTNSNITDSIATIDNGFIHKSATSRVIKSFYDTTTLYTFGGGGGNSADTNAFTTNSIYGSFFTADTLVITNINAVMAHGIGNDTLGIQIKWHTTFLSGSATLLSSSTIPIGRPNGKTTGTVISSFTNPIIPKGVRVWMVSPTVINGKKPVYLEVSLRGYRKR